jgi:hypothetical protein
MNRANGTEKAVTAAVAGAKSTSAGVGGVLPFIICPSASHTLGLATSTGTVIIYSMNFRTVVVILLGVVLPILYVAYMLFFG